MKLRKLLVLLLLLGAAFILSACGKDGIQGETGDTGLKGETGAQGDKGAIGVAGDAGAKGETGANGVGIQFSYGSEGILWRYIGASEWNTGVAFADLFAFLDTEKVAFDYYVDPKLSLDEGAPLIARGNELVVGKTAFKSISAALTAIAAAAEEKGYDGATLFLEKGTYADAFTVSVDDLTIKGPNAGIFAGGEESRKDEAEISAKITVADGVKGLRIDGLKFSGAGQVVATNTTDLAFIYNLLEGTNSDGIVRVTGTGTNLGVCYNYTESHTGARFIWLQNADGINASCNIIKAESAGGKFDFINASGYIKGKVRIIGNTYQYSEQSFLYVKGVGLIDAEIAGNTIVGVKNTAIDFRNMSEDGANKFNIHHNEFDNAGCGWCPIRIRVAGYDENDSLAVTLTDNAFIDSFYDDEGTPQFAEEPTEGRKVYTVGKNYYSKQGTAITALVDANFSGAAASMEDPYATLADIPEYELPGDLVPLTKFEKALAELAAEFIADFKTATGRQLSTIAYLDTDHMESSEMTAFLSDAGMISKWEWLLVALADLSEDNTHDPTLEGFNAEENRGFFLANINAFFTVSQHKDTHLGTESMDLSDAALVKSILALNVPKVDYDALLTELAAAFLTDYNATCGTELESIAELDTANLGGKTIATFYQNATMNEKWGWLYEAVSEFDDEMDCTADGFDWTDLDNMGYYLANINGFFTKSVHKDTYCAVTSADFTDQANVKAVLDAYLNK